MPSGFLVSPRPFVETGCLDRPAIEGPEPRVPVPGHLNVCPRPSSSHVSRRIHVLDYTLPCSYKRLNSNHTDFDVFGLEVSTLVSPSRLSGTPVPDPPRDVSPTRPHLDTSLGRPHSPRPRTPSTISKPDAGRQLPQRLSLISPVVHYFTHKDFPVISKSHFLPNLVLCLSPPTRSSNKVFTSVPPPPDSLGHGTPVPTVFHLRKPCITSVSEVVPSLSNLRSYGVPLRISSSNCGTGPGLDPSGFPPYPRPLFFIVSDSVQWGLQGSLTVHLHRLSIHTPKVYNRYLFLSFVLFCGHPPPSTKLNFINTVLGQPKHYEDSLCWLTTSDEVGPQLGESLRPLSAFCSVLLFTLSRVPLPSFSAPGGPPTLGK